MALKLWQLIQPYNPPELDPSKKIISVSIGAIRNDQKRMLIKIVALKLLH